MKASIVLAALTAISAEVTATCFSEKLGYKCCKDNVVEVIDEDGAWGIENNEWCGIDETYLEKRQFDFGGFGGGGFDFGGFGGGAPGGGAPAGGAPAGSAPAGGGGGGDFDFCSTSQHSGESVTENSNKVGSINGIGYELWADSGSNSATFYSDGSFSCSMQSAGDYLCRSGLSFDSTQTHDQIGQITADFKLVKENVSNVGYSYVGIYGWTRDPLVEYYIVDNWLSPDRPGSWVGNVCHGDFDIDGAQYTVYENDRFGPSIDGDTQFKQYFSIRQTARDCGRIDITAHFKQWESLGMKLGKMHEAKVLGEAGNGSGGVSGTADFPYAKVYIGSSPDAGAAAAPATAPAADPAATAPAAEAPAAEAPAADPAATAPAADPAAAPAADPAATVPAADPAAAPAADPAASAQGDATAAPAAGAATYPYPLKNAPVPSKGCGAAPSITSGSFDLNWSMGTRQVHINIPDSYDNSKPYRLIFGMQCMGGSGAQVVAENFYGLKPFDGEGTTIFVAPEGNGNQLPWDENDYTMFDELLEKLKNELCIDESRVFSVGFSYGSMFSNGLSWNHQKVLRAVACYETAERNIPLPDHTGDGIGWMGVLGFDDDLCTPEMGRSARDIILKHNSEGGAAVNEQAEEATPGGPHTCYDYTTVKEEFPVRWCTESGGHLWEHKDPGSSNTWVPEATWEFINKF